MLRARRQDDLTTLRGMLRGFPGGASLDQIAVASPLAKSRRTLIRNLAELVETGTVVKAGLSRAARYTLRKSASPSPSKAARPAAQTAEHIPLSRPASEVLRKVSLPERQRRPVGYNRTFLDGYRPNRTRYLTAAEKGRLHVLGKSAMASGEQPAGTYARRILNRLLIDLSFNSSRLEGNTYSLLETQRLIDLGEEAEGKEARDAQMILNHKAAIEFLVESAEDIAFDRRTILNLHALLAENLLPDPHSAGRLRQIEVAIGKSAYHPLAVPQSIEEVFAPHSHDGTRTIHRNSRNRTARPSRRQLRA